MSPVELLLKGRKKLAKQCAKNRHIIDLSTMAIPYGFHAVERWKIGAYLLGWISWREVEDILKG